MIALCFALGQCLYLVKLPVANSYEPVMLCRTVCQKSHLFKSKQGGADLFDADTLANLFLDAVQRGDHLAGLAVIVLNRDSATITYFCPRRYSIVNLIGSCPNLLTAKQSLTVPPNAEPIVTDQSKLPRAPGAWFRHCCEQDECTDMNRNPFLDNNSQW